MNDEWFVEEGPSQDDTHITTIKWILLFTGHGKMGICALTMVGYGNEGVLSNPERTDGPASLAGVRMAREDNTEKETTVGQTLLEKRDARRRAHGRGIQKSWSRVTQYETLIRQASNVGREKEEDKAL
ncbi:hypothetical protein TRVL_07884 [Trypanosoma vivax]|nr:hypothetical protein TRVL_07884 [Trypanosoma vivax]